MQGVFVSKYLLNQQTGASTTTTDGTLFEAEVSISGYSPTSFTIDGSTYSLTNGLYENEESANSAALDTAFGNSYEYSFTNPDGASTAYTFTPSNNGSFAFDYPSTPILELTNGSWNDGKYTINKNDSLGVSTLSPATSDPSFKMSFIEINGEETSEDLLDPYLSFNMENLQLGVTNTDVTQSGSIDLSTYSLGTYDIEIIQMHGYELRNLTDFGGDWSGIGLFTLGSITVVELEVVPEPSQAALLIGIVAIAMVGLRRRANS